ncbi:MAG: putative electron transfer flavoprotein FixA [Burkholderiales bacterium]|nr:putative electron transfer flavoprotein FixA [Burkholderiales bacterium]
MKIIIGQKIVYDEQDITITAKRTLDLGQAMPKLNPFDLNAIEAGVQIAAVHEGSTVTALCVGEKKLLENSKVRKDVLSRGVDHLTLVMDDALSHALPQVSARVLAAASRKIGFDLIICGDGSGDLYAQQVGLLLGEELDIPAINAISKILSVSPDHITVERTLEDKVQVLSIPLPAVIAVTADINVPKIPNMKAILGAAKKPVVAYSFADMGFEPSSDINTEMIEMVAPLQKERALTLIEGDDEEKIAAFAQHLKKAIQ